MPGETQHGMQCSEFDLLLTDAIDGLLTGERLASFEQHKEFCRSCATLFADVTAGLGWLQQIEEIEPPKNLVHNIVVATTGVRVAEIAAQAEAEAKKPFWERIQNIVPRVLAPVRTPRFAMSAAMAFFSISLAFSATGRSIKDVNVATFSPRSIQSKLLAAQGKALHYYDSLRVVYEIESRVRELREYTVTDDTKTDGKDKKENKQNKKQGKDETTTEPEKDYRNYSQERQELLMASVTVGDERIGNLARQRRLG